MKNIIILIIALSFFACKSQEIVSYYDTDGSILLPNSGKYYKDVHNDFNKFEGHWLYEDASTNSKIEIKLRKEEFINLFGYYYDALIGEYLYQENGSVLINTLNNFDSATITGFEHAIRGVIILSSLNKPPCYECDPSERRMEVKIFHPDYEDVSTYLIMRHKIVAGVEKIDIFLIGARSLSNDPNAPTSVPIPLGQTFTLTKQ